MRVFEGEGLIEAATECQKWDSICYPQPRRGVGGIREGTTYVCFTHRPSDPLLFVPRCRPALPLNGQNCPNCQNNRRLPSSLIFFTLLSSSSSPIDHTCFDLLGFCLPSRPIYLANIFFHSTATFRKTTAAISIRYCLSASPLRAPFCGANNIPVHYCKEARHLR